MAEQKLTEDDKRLIAACLEERRRLRQELQTYECIVDTIKKELREMSYTELGRKFDITSQRIRKLESRWLAKS